MKSKILAGLFFLIGLNVFGQELEPINTDRPDQSEGTYVLPKGIFQIEGGLTYSEGSLAPNVMLRHGLGKRTEVRIETDFGKDIWSTEFNDFTISMKHRLLKSEKFTLIGIGYFAYDNMEGDRYNGDVLLTMDYDFSEKWSLVGNIGSSDGFDALKVSSQLEFSFEERWTTFGEYIGQYSALRLQHTLATGIKYLWKNNLQLDAILGFAAFKSDTDTFIAMGVGYRFNKKKK